MTDLAGALQQAIYNALNPEVALRPVATEAPTDVDGDVEVVVYPFTLLGDDQVTDEGSKDARFERHEVAIHRVDQSTTKLEIREAQEMIRARLQGQSITAVGAIFSDPVFLNQSITMLDDGSTQVGTQTFLIFAQEAI